MTDRTRVVVIGAGMVGHRFTEELHRLDPSVDITLLGEEEYEPYNRILLTELLAGRVDLAGLTMSAHDESVTVRLGSPALEIDRERNHGIVAAVERSWSGKVLLQHPGRESVVVADLPHDWRHRRVRLILVGISSEDADELGYSLLENVHYQ